MFENITIREARASDSAKWNDYVLSCPESGPYHLWQWRDAVYDAYKHTPHYLIAEEKVSNKITGILPLFCIKPPFVKAQLVSLPFCDYGGPLAVSPNATKELCEAAKDIAGQKKATLELRCAAPLPDVTPLSLFGDKVRMLLDLPENSQILFKQFKSKLRSQIRRPIKDGLYAKIGGVELLQDFYQVFTINMRDLGSPVHSRRWFEALMTHFYKKARIGIVYKEKTPVACGIILLHTDTVSIPWASSLRSFNRFSPNMLLYWSLLEYAADNGYRRFDFGRSSPGSGTFRFKKQWGAEPRALFWYSDSKAHDAVSPGPGKTRALAEKVWAKLPFCVSNHLGPKIRKYISL